FFEVQLFIGQFLFLLLCPESFDELANLASDRIEKFKDVCIRLTALPAEKFDDAIHACPSSNRERETARQRFLRCYFRAGKIRIRGKIDKPMRLVALPYTSRETDSGTKLGFFGQCGELRSSYRVSLPEVDASNTICVAIHIPKCTDIPV